MPDALNNGLYLEQQLVEYDRNVIQPVYQDFWTLSGKNHVTQGDLPVGLPKINVSKIDEYGEATIVSGRSSDFQLADVGAEMVGFNTTMVAIGVKWSQMEIEQARIATRMPMIGITDPVEAKVRAAENKISLKLHNTILFGHTPTGFRGWFNSTQIPETPVNPAEKPLIMTPDQLYDWIAGITDVFAEKNGLSSEQIFMYVDKRLLTKIRKSPIVNGTVGHSAYNQLISESAESVGNLKGIRAIYELSPSIMQSKGGLAANTGRILLGAYDKMTAAKRRYFLPKRTSVDRIPMTIDEMGFILYAGTSEVMHLTPMLFQQINYSTALV